MIKASSLAFALGLSSVVAACGTPQAPQKPDVRGQPIVLAGEGVGNVKLTMTGEQVRAVIGKYRAGSTELDDKSPSTYYKDDDGYQVAMNTPAQMMFIRLCGFDKGDCKPFVGSTPEGLNVGSSAAEVRAKLGKPTNDSDSFLEYDDRGISFDFAKDGTVSEITVKRKAAAATPAAP